MGLRVLRGGKQDSEKKKSKLNRRQPPPDPMDGPPNSKFRAPKYNEKQVRDALIEACGLVSRAAQILNVNPAQIYGYLKRWPRLTMLKTVTDELLLDLAETKLFQLVQEGDKESVRFVLRCKGKSRGWVEQKPMMESSGSVDNTPKSITFAYQEVTPNHEQIASGS